MIDKSVAFRSVFRTMKFSSETSLSNFLLIGSVLSLCFVSSAYGMDYCELDCAAEFFNSTNPHFQKCTDAQLFECGGMPAYVIALNILIGLLTLIGLIAIVIRCCLAIRLIRGRESRKSSKAMDDEDVQEQPLHNSSGVQAIVT